MSNILLYHTDNDGFGARVAFELYHPEKFDYHEFEYGRTLPELNGYEHIVFCDVTPDIQELISLVQSGVAVTILDHHVSFRDKVRRTKLERYRNFNFFFDETVSGAVIAYYYARSRAIQDVKGAIDFGESFPPLLFRYISDRDLWKWDLEDSKEVNAGLDSVPKTVEEWRKYVHDVSNLYDMGKAVVSHINATVELIAKQTLDLDEDGKYGLCNCTSHWSEVGNYIVEELGYETAFLYHEMGNGNRKWSIRGDNARKFAEIGGGGGHERAAGFLEDQDIEGWAARTLEWLTVRYEEKYNQ